MPLVPYRLRGRFAQAFLSREHHRPAFASFHRRTARLIRRRP